MTSTELVLITTSRSIIPAEAFSPGGLDGILAAIEREVRSVDTDVSTAAGRKNIASLAYKVARTKTALDEMGKTLVGDLKKQTAAIDAERKKARDRLDALKDDVRKPLDEYEAREAQRIAAHEAALAAIVEGPGYGQSETAAEIRARLDHLKAYPPRDWQEFAARAEKTITAEIERTEALLAAAEKREAEQAELQRLRREAEERAAREAAERAEREQREREERAAAAARAEAEAKAKREAEEAERRAQAERERVEREKAEAERLAAEAEQRAAEAERRAEQERKEAAARAEAERVAAEERAKAAAEEAARRERQRIEDEQRREREAAAKREADKAHRARINREARAALMAVGLPEDAATLAITAIAKGAVPHVDIRY